MEKTDKSHHNSHMQLMQCPSKPTPSAVSPPLHKDLGHHHFVLPLDPSKNHFTSVNTPAKALLGQGYAYTYMRAKVFFF